MVSCKLLAYKNGLTWYGSGNNYPYSGCYTYAETGKAYFGNWGTGTQMLQVIEGHAGWWIPLRVPSLDTDCLLLSNQAKLLISLTKCYDFSVHKCPTANGCVASRVGHAVRCDGTWRLI